MCQFRDERIGGYGILYTPEDQFKTEIPVQGQPCGHYHHPVLFLPESENAGSGGEIQGTYDRKNDENPPVGNVIAFPCKHPYRRGEHLDQK